MNGERSFISFVANVYGTVDSSHTHIHSSYWLTTCDQTAVRLRGARAMYTRNYFIDQFRLMRAPGAADAAREQKPISKKVIKLSMRGRRARQMRT